jgi:predicted DNA-binding transcriptional regulator YafY
VITLLDLLQSGGTHTVAELAQRLDVDERTVRRYVDHLRELDIPVESLRGRYGGYRLAPGQRMPPLMLTDDEALATVLGLIAARQTEGQLSAASDSALAKIRRVLPRALSRKLEALVASASFTDTAAPPPEAETRILLTLAEAARDQRRVLVGYASRNGASRERILEPFGLVSHSGRWYVAARDPQRNATRTFRLDRITDPRLLAERFTLPQGFDATEHVIEGLANGPWAHEVSVLVHAGEEKLRRRLPANLANLERVDADAATADATLYRLRFRAERLDWVPSILAGLDSPFTIEEPAELRDGVAALAKRLEDYASNTTDRDLRANGRSSSRN